MFDLPTETAQERKEYRQFRKKLINEGFVMVQFSVYVRVCVTRQTAKFLEKRVENFLPHGGLVQSLMVTEKQYNDMCFLVGKPVEDVRNTSDRTVILSYLTHRKWILQDSGVTVITLQSPIAYRDLVQGFKGENSLLLCSDGDFNSLEITKTFDFVGDPLLSEDISKRYLTFVVNNYVKTIDEENRNKVFKAYYNLETVLHDSLLLEDLPIDIDFNEDLKKLLKLVEIHFDRSILTNPYAIIETVLKIHQNYDLGTIPVFCNVAHYFDEQEWQEVANLAMEVNSSVIFLEFTNPQNLKISKNITCYYIDQDLVDWY